MNVRGFALFAVAAATLAQQAPSRDVPAQPPIVGTATIAGTVLNGATGSDPARKARVMVNSVDGRIPGITATTDDEGRFVLRGVPGGRFTVEAFKPGYLRAFYGAARPNRSGTPVSVTDGGRIEGLTIRIVPGAAVSGTVRDARGRPVPGIGVDAYRYGYSSFGERQLTPQKSATTDDLGEYRVWGLPPGEYVVAATPTGVLQGSQRDFTSLTTSDVDRLLQGARADAISPVPAAAPTSTSNFAPVFYPSTSDLARATPLSISAGEDRQGIDLGIALVRTAQIVGVVTTSDGQPVGAANVTLSSVGEVGNLLGGSGAWRPKGVYVGTDGRFTFQAVSPGPYRVLVQTTPGRSGATAGASQVGRFAASEVAVNGADITLALTLQPTMTIAGRLVFDGTTAPPDNLTVMQVRLVPPGNGPINAVPGGQLAADGTFTFTDVTPNDYRVLTVNRTQWTGDWWLRSAIANGRDALDGPIRISPGDKSELVLTYTDRPSDLSGEFQDATGRPAPDYFIVVFPADKALRLPGSRWIRSTRPGNDGHYALRGMPPGEYFLAALTDLDNEDLNTPSFFDQLAGLAVRVTLAEGRMTKQDLRVGK